MHFDYFQRKSAVQVLNIIITNSLSYQSLLVWWQSIRTSNQEVSGWLISYLENSKFPFRARDSPSKYTCLASTFVVSDDRNRDTPPKPRRNQKQEAETPGSLVIVFKTEFARGPGRGDTCHLSNLDETLPD